MASEDSSNPSTVSRTDPGWKYCHQSQDNGTSSCVCKFCAKTMWGGITRMKEHLIGKKGNCKACTKCPKEVREELIQYEKNKKKKDSQAFQRMRNDLFDDSGDSDEERILDEGAREIATRLADTRGQNIALKGPMDLYYGRPKTAIENKKKGKEARQTSIREKCVKEATADVHQYIARFWYQAGLSFNMVKLESFQEMLTAVGSFGKNLRPPSYHEMRVPLLAKELAYTEDLLKKQREQWGRFGCSIMSDGWTDRKQRSIINFLVNCPSGTMFIKSIDASDIVKTGEKIFELLDSIVEEIGEEKVVQLITDNGSNYVLAGKLLEEKRPHLFWTPCAAHCIDLMLEDIGKLPSIKKTIQKAIFLVGFIYNHSSTLSLLRYFTNKRELVRHAITRFATSFLTLQRIHKEKGNLRKMFVSDDWTNNKLSKEAKGREATKIVLMPSFWSNILYTLKVMAPLVRVLRLVDSEKKPAMGYIYEAMEKAKEAIMKSFEENESKYREVFDIIDKRWTSQLHRPLHAAGHFLNPEFFYDNPSMEFDFEVTTGLYACIQKLVPIPEVRQKIIDELPIYKGAAGMFANPFAISSRKTTAPAQWWRNYGQSTPNLQLLAVKILSLTCSASGCERNWSVWEQVHSKKRNRLDYKKLHNLVYIKYNQALIRRYNIKDEIDPISLNDIDECNEWLVGQMDGDEEDAGNERVFGDEDESDALNWEAVYKASGVGEPRVYTRQRTKKRKEAPSGAGAASKTKKGSASGSSSRKGKEIVVEVEDEEPEEEEEEEEEEELEDIDFEDSEVEEVEGYASLSDNENDDYIEQGAEE